MKEAIKLFTNFISGLITFFIPRSSKIVICGGWSGGRFADNSKAMFLYLSQNKDKLGLKRVIFVTKNQKICEELLLAGYDSIMCKSLKSIWYHLRAKYHIVDSSGMDVHRTFSVGAVRINLWHGFPLKKIGYIIGNEGKPLQDIIDMNYKLKRSFVGHWNDVYLLALGEAHSKHMQRAFGVPDSKIITGFYPRCVYMNGGINKFYLHAEKDAAEKIETLKTQGKKIILYFPTFRDKIEYNDKCISAIYDLQSYLEEHDYYMVTKLHFAAVTDKNINKLTERVINLKPESDVYNFLSLADVLITDYSSVYFDFLLLNKPVIFYCFDLDYYQNGDRGFLYDYASFTPGEKADTIEDLYSAITFACEKTEAYKEKYEKQSCSVKEIVYGDTSRDIDELWSKIKQI
ncbi:MAG: CDP-glycerol glycerophosphotransferase family protein [Bacillota bacterium]|nr:CDP-glycerol glycerophosphotransferase family protein [Bacillota bacterium]